MCVRGHRSTLLRYLPQPSMERVGNLRFLLFFFCFFAFFLMWTFWDVVYLAILTDRGFPLSSLDSSPFLSLSCFTLTHLTLNKKTSLKNVKKNVFHNETFSKLWYWKFNFTWTLLTVVPICSSMTWSALEDAYCHLRCRSSVIWRVILPSPSVVRFF